MRGGDDQEGTRIKERPQPGPKRVAHGKPRSGAAVGNRIVNMRSPLQGREKRVASVKYARILVSLPHRRRMSNAHQQTFRSQ